MVINQTSDRHETLMVSMAPGRVPRSGMVCMSLVGRRSELPAPVSTDPLECFFFDRDLQSCESDRCVSAKLT